MKHEMSDDLRCRHKMFHDVTEGNSIFGDIADELDRLQSKTEEQESEISLLHAEVAELRAGSFKYKHPMQDIARDDRGTMRFVENKIVSHILDFARDQGCGLNELACMDFEHNDWRQLAQLIGYSVDGFFDLSYASNTWDMGKLDDGFHDYANRHCEAARNSAQDEQKTCLDCNGTGRDNVPYGEKCDECRGIGQRRGE